MKRRNIAPPIVALGLALSSVFASIPLGASVALADDDYDNGNRPAWSYRCDRNWNPQYCLPNQGNTRNQDWRNNRDWRSQDLGRLQAWCDRQGWRNNQDSRNDSDWQRSQEWCDRQDWRNSQDSRNNQDWRNNNRNRRLSTGTQIPTSIERRRQIVLNRWDDRASLTLLVNRDIQDNRGRVVIRRDSRIQGELVPKNNGYRFEADRIILPNGNTEDISAVSRVINSNDYSYDRDRRQTNVSNAAIIIISSVLRGATNQPHPDGWGNVLGGSTNRSNSGIFGDVFDPRSPRSRNDEVVIYPEQDLDLRLTRDFSLD
jgi:hypothetical protein